MIPLHDDNPTRTRAWLTVVLIAVNVFVFFVVQPGSTDVNATAEFNYKHAAIPCEVTTGEPLSIEEILPAVRGVDDDHCVHHDTTRELFPGKQVFVAVLVSMFLHGSLLHLGGNMLFLWVFGNNIEDRLGRVRYGAFYLASGLAAALTHIALQPHSTVPVIGASGAIAGVMGAYLVWFPNAPVRTLVFLGFFAFVPRISAKWLLGLWFVSQFFINPNEGVAWGAHVGGFVFGALIALVLRPRRPSPPPPDLGWAPPAARPPW